MPRRLLDDPQVFALDEASTEPLYRQLRRWLERRILAGTLEPRRRLPSSRELAAELGLSRTTVNLAYQELLAEGFLEARPRSGIYINEELRRSPRPPAPAPTGASAPTGWSEQLRRSADVDLPSIEKIPDWQHYPYPFIAGQVDGSTFPVAAWTRCLRDALYPPHVHFSLRDAIGADDPLLVEMLCRHILPGRGIDAAPEEVLVTMGSQEGLYGLATCLLEPGDRVGCEDPGYLDARHIFVRAGAELVGLPVDGSGLVPPGSLSGLSLLHLTPSHQHPTNVKLTVGRRRQLLHLAAQAGTVVVEDDYDSELRYQGSPSPALKALDHTGTVVYMGTFSKFLAPGLRLGYLVGAPELIEHLRVERRYRIRHPPGHVQRAMALFIESGQYQTAVRRHRSALRRKWETLAGAIDRCFPFPVTLPPGGVTAWIEGPPELDGPTLVVDALRHGVIVERGDIFFTEPWRGRHCFRLGFSATPARAIEPGIALLGRLLEEQLATARPRPATRAHPPA
jgi:GntR family transcriptional regulator/MocR family aminotransferase